MTIGGTNLSSPMDKTSSSVIFTVPHMIKEVTPDFYLDRKVTAEANTQRFMSGKGSCSTYSKNSLGHNLDKMYAHY